MQPRHGWWQRSFTSPFGTPQSRIKPLFRIAGVRVAFLRDLHSLRVISTRYGRLVARVESSPTNDMFLKPGSQAAGWIGASDACDYGWGFVILKGHDSGPSCQPSTITRRNLCARCYFSVSLLHMHICVKPRSPKFMPRGSLSRTYASMPSANQLRSRSTRITPPECTVSRSGTLRTTAR